MPELPEVESIKLQLEKYLIGHVVESVEIRYKKCFSGSVKNVVGGRIKRVRRFGKALAIDLNNGYSILIHVKMTGQLIYRGSKLGEASRLSKKIIGGLGGKHTHVIFHLDGSGKLYYNDVRRFGWIKVIKTNELKTKNEFIKKLGPEPLTDITKSPQEKLTLNKFEALVNSTRRAIKTLLMDQSKISGVGNIYAIDALWEAGISPTKESNKLGPDEVKKLFKAIEKVLKKGLRYGGASEWAFVTPDGSEGSYQKHFAAYGRGGETCPRCRKGVFAVSKISGRGTVHCPVCQV